VTDTPAPANPEGRAAHVISQAYYYVAAVVGFGLFLGGAIGTLFGVRELILPREYETTREGVRTILHGLAFALPGLALMWWHLRQARRRESRPAAAAPWGAVLYFHLVSLLSLVFVLIGGIGLLFSLADAASSDCEPPPPPVVIPAEAPGELTAIEESFEEGDFCYPGRSDSLRNGLDSSIFLIVAGPVFWWHLRQGRRLTAPPPDA